jgi:hypothetical protein
MAMKQKQDGKRTPEYVDETEDEIRRLVEDKGAGGKGLHETAEDAALRGVTPGLAKAQGEAAKKSDTPGK